MIDQRKLHQLTGRKLEAYCLKVVRQETKRLTMILKRLRKLRQLREKSDD